MSSLFENATRNKYRFESSKGMITTEDLWSMPLLSTSKVSPEFDLDHVAKTLNSKIKLLEEESFVSVKTTENTQLYEQLEIAKYVIATKLAEQAALADKSVKRAELTKLTSILAQKQDLDMLSMSTKELEAKIASLQA